MNNTLEHFYTGSDFENKRKANIARLKKRYNDKLGEYYTSYQTYLINYFSPSNNGVTVQRSDDEIEFQKAEGTNTFLKNGESSSPGGDDFPSLGLACSEDGIYEGQEGCTQRSDYANKLAQNKASCIANKNCMGFDNKGNYFKGGTIVSGNTGIATSGRGGNFRTWKKLTTKVATGVEIPTMGKLESLKSELDTILAQLRTNIDATDSKLVAEADELEKKRDEILERNRQIVMQGKSLDLMNLKLVSRERQNEFSIERNRYRRIMIVVLIVCNVILMGYFGFLLTKK